MSSASSGTRVTCLRKRSQTMSQLLSRCRPMLVRVTKGKHTIKCYHLTHNYVLYIICSINGVCFVYFWGASYQRKWHRRSLNHISGFVRHYILPTKLTVPSELIKTPTTLPVWANVNPIWTFHHDWTDTCTVSCTLASKLTLAVANHSPGIILFDVFMKQLHDRTVAISALFLSYGAEVRVDASQRHFCVSAKLQN